MGELEEENEHLKKQNMMLNEAKIKLRQETSLLTADNMVCVYVCERELQRLLGQKPMSVLVTGLGRAAGPEKQNNQETGVSAEEP